MSWKVKRGLGLLVIAVIGWLLLLPLLRIDAPDSSAGNAAMVVALLVVVVAAIGCLLAGLGLLAWGLLRD